MSLVLLVSSIRKGKRPVVVVKNPALIQLIYRKTRLYLKSIRISASEKPWGMMVGLPRYPYMILSSQLMKTFNADEIEYVVLHEAGHYVLAHSAKLAILFVSFIIFGSITVTDIPIPFIWVPITLFIGLIMIQASRLCEYEADAFALYHLTNPKGMISATKKFEKAYHHFGPVRHDEDTLLGRLIYMGIPYNARIRSAEREMQKRK